MDNIYNKRLKKTSFESAQWDRRNLGDSAHSGGYLYPNLIGCMQMSVWDLKRPFSSINKW